MNQRRLIFSVLLVFVAVAGVIGLGNWLSRPAITMVTDNQPVSLSIGDKIFMIRNTTQKIRLAGGSFSYKATHDLAGDNISLYGTVNTATGQNIIVLNYNIFTKQSIKQALCQADGVSPANCGDGYNPQWLAFTADHSWAVVTLSPSDELESNYEVLRLQNGQWEKIAGPTGAADLQGVVPDSVLGVINR
jgi:hypothetical protein